MRLFHKHKWKSHPIPDQELRMIKRGWICLKCGKTTLTRPKRGIN